MKAIAITARDKVELIDKQKPQLRPKELLIKIKTAALNHRDQWIRQGMYPGIEYGVTLGSDGFGVVEEVGSEVKGEWIGKEVLINPNIGWGEESSYQASDYSILGMPKDGTFAEYVAVSEDRIHLAIHGLKSEEQAAIPLAGLTAYRALFTHGKLSNKQNVLITGIGGGVAQFAFQFGKSVSDQVYVTSGSIEKLDKVKSTGASGGFNYKTEDWHKIALKEVGGFNLIIDSTGGSLFSKYIDLIKPGGKIVFYGASAGMPEKVDLFKIFWKQATLQGSTMGNDEEFADMLQFVKSHNIKPVIDNVYAPEDWKSAFDRMKEGKQLGKIVLKF
ncbi:MAG: zinc-binding dehydrogenase [Bacteroidota bacterium]